MEDKINLLRDQLHKELEADTINYEKVLEISQELDLLIVKYHREEKGK